MATKNKDHQYVVRTLSLPDGSRKYFYGATEKEAEAKRDDYKVKLAGGLIPDDKTTFGEVAKIWVEKYKAPYLKPGSLRTLRSRVNTHIMSKFAPLRIRSITPLMCQNLLADVAKAQYCDCNGVQSNLRDIFDVAIELGCITRNPVAVKRKLPSYKRKRGEKQIISRDLQNKILAGLTPLSQEYMLFLIGMETGMRRGEILALDWGNIDLKKRTIRVCQNLVDDPEGRFTLVPYLKTEDGQRTLPITNSLFRALSTITSLQNPSGLLFRWNGSHYTIGAFNGAWRRIRRACELHDPEFADGFTSHVMRHTYITRLYEAGLDLKEIQTLAGHKDAATTLDTYTHYDKASRQEATFDSVRKFLDVPQEDESNVVPFPKIG